MKIKIRESQIEDALVSISSLTSNLLNLKDEPRLIVRQWPIPSGRLDLLYTYQNKLLLIELKVVRFQSKFLKQILNYKSDLVNYQQKGKLIKGDIASYLLCTETTKSEQSLAREKGIFLTEYDPKYVLNIFHENFKPIVFFTETKPIDIGIWNIHLIHNLLYLLEGTTSIKKLKQAVDNSEKTLHNKIRFASKLKLIDWLPNCDKVSLTELGEKYVENKNKEFPDRTSANTAGVCYEKSL